MPFSARLAWVGPTLRLIPWRGLALVAGGAALIGSLGRVASGSVSPEVGIVALATTAAVVPQVLDDPAHQLLSSVPLSRRRRVGHRLVLFLPVLLVGWLLVAPMLIGRRHASAVSVAPLLALATIGLAAGCLVSRVLPALAPPVGTATTLGIAAIPLAFAHAVTQADILDVWIDHPWATVAVAGLVCIVSLDETLPSRDPRRRRTDPYHPPGQTVDLAEPAPPPPIR
jgi:hypothetical protein